MKLFNEYGVIVNPETRALEDSIFGLVADHLKSLVSQGATPVEIRAVTVMLAQSATVAGSEAILRMQMAMRKRGANAT